METDVPPHELIHEDDEGNLRVGSVAQTPPKGEEERGISRVDCGVRESHDLRGVI